MKEGRRGGLKQAKRRCLDRERWGLFAMAILLRGAPGVSETSETIDG